jgi:prophage tail gpP-like protein
MWACADRICRELGFLIWMAPQLDTRTVEVVVDAPLSDGDPTFQFMRVEDTQTGTFSGKILRGSHRRSLRGIPTEVTGFAHTALTDGTDSRLQVTVFNDKLAAPWVVDDPIPQPRFLSNQQASTQDAIRRVGQREIAKPMEMFRVYECDQRGFTQRVNNADQNLTINTLARVKDTRRAIDEVMLMTSVTFKRSRKGGTVATTRMVPKGAIHVIPEAS